MKAVIYKENGIFKTTTEKNYNAQIQDAHLVQTWKDFESAEEIINYLITYCNRKEEDFIIKI